MGTFKCCSTRGISPLFSLPRMESDDWEQAATGQSAEFGTPEVLQVLAGADACQNAHALLSCKVDLQNQAGSEWPGGE